jgi:hypothetical protein
MIRMHIMLVSFDKLRTSGVKMKNECGKNVEDD